MELEGQIRQLKQMLAQQKEAEEELVARIGKLQEEKRDLQDRFAGLQRAMAEAESEKRDLERAHVRLEKDKKALRQTLDRVCNKQCWLSELLFLFCFVFAVVVCNNIHFMIAHEGNIYFVSRESLLRLGKHRDSREAKQMFLEGAIIKNFVI